MLWSSDSFAYFVGRKLGKTKLFPRISPKKSWEGSIGGLVCTMALAVGISYLFPVFPMRDWLVIAVIIVVFGTWGDLAESHFKRSIQIKDSGNSLMGHGGFLDRFDGFFVSAPIVVGYIQAIQFFK
jgi:phosphatidate cytidylyltransferase